MVGKIMTKKISSKTREILKAEVVKTPKKEQERDPLEELDKQVKIYPGFTLTFYPDTQEITIKIDYEKTHIKTYELKDDIAQLIHQKYKDNMVNYADTEFQKAEFENS